MDQAVADFNEAIRLQPNGTIGFQYRGVAYQQAGQRDRAIADYRKALQLSPANGLARDALKELGVEP